MSDGGAPVRSGVGEGRCGDWQGGRERSVVVSGMRGRIENQPGRSCVGGIRVCIICYEAVGVFIDQGARFLMCSRVRGSTLFLCWPGLRAL